MLVLSVGVKAFEEGDQESNIVGPRKLFDKLIFGGARGPDPVLFSHAGAATV